MKNNREIYIKCPNCGAEYMPSEIYLPNSFLGRAYWVDKTNTGQIEDYGGSNIDPFEQYQCDYCNLKFRVFAKIQFATSEISKYKANEDYTTTLKKEKLFLNED